jgi:hypothetical protein|tara:strand:+ start:268 stop:858 length:591 start_codon:yes stop_codon:yes gene_type:complete
MDSFSFYTNLGLFHVLDFNALDHLYFLVALASSFSYSKISRLIYAVTFFTIGHTLALLLNYFLKLPLNFAIIEFLIPVTIFLTCFPLILENKKLKSFELVSSLYFIWLLTLTFGVIHGFGFSNFYSQIDSESLNLYNLIYFSLGIEFAQIIIVLAVIFFKILVNKVLSVSLIKIEKAIGIMILFLSSLMIYENIPF